MFLDKPFHLLGPLVCLPLVLRTFAEAHNACDDAHQIGDPALEGSMGKHQVHERLRERLEGRFVRVRKIVRRHACSSVAILVRPRRQITDPAAPVEEGVMAGMYSRPYQVAVTSTAGRGPSWSCCRRAILFVGPAHDDPERVILFQFFHLCRQIGISAYSVGGILARQNSDIVIRL